MARAFLLGLSALALAGCSTLSPKPPPLSYSIPSRFSLTYPSSFAPSLSLSPDYQQRLDAFGEDTRPLPYETLVTFGSPVFGACDQPHLRLEVGFTTLRFSTQDIPLRHLVEAYTRHVDKTLTNFSVVDSGLTVFCNYPAHRVVLTGRPKNSSCGEELTFVRNFVTRGNTFYMIGYTVPTGEYTTSRDNLENILATFTFEE
jgi:hypothetical protein